MMNEYQECCAKLRTLATKVCKETIQSHVQFLSEVEELTLEAVQLYFDGQSNDEAVTNLLKDIARVYFAYDNDDEFTQRCKDISAGALPGNILENKPIVLAFIWKDLVFEVRTDEYGDTEYRERPKLNEGEEDYDDECYDDGWRVTESVYSQVIVDPTFKQALQGAEERLLRMNDPQENKEQP